MQIAIGIEWKNVAFFVKSMVEGLTATEKKMMYQLKGGRKMIKAKQEAMQSKRLVSTSVGTVLS